MLRTQFRALGAATALAVLVCPLAAQTTTTAAANPFAKALPESTLMYMSFPNFSKSLEEFQSMPLAKMWAEDEVQDFFERAMTMGKDYWEQGMAQAREMHEQGQLPFDPDELVKARLESLSFAITSMELQMPEGAREPLPRFGFVMHADFGQTAPIWNQVLRTGLMMLQGQAGDEMETSVTEVGGASLTTMRPVGVPIDMGLNIAFVGNGVLIGSLENEVSGMLSALAGDSANTLTASSAFAAVSQNVSFDGAEMEFFMRPAAMIDFGMNTLRMAAENAPDFPPELDVDGIERVVDALGLRGIQAIGSSSRYVGGKSVSDSFVVAPKAARQGFLANDAGGTVDMGFLRWVPKDAVSFSAGRMDLEQIYSTLVGALNAYDENLAGMVLGQLAGMEEQLGLSLKDDLFGAFGRQYVTWSMPVAALGTTPEMGVIIEVKDQERILKTLQTAADLSEGALVLKKTRRGTYQLRIEADMGGDMGGFNPADMFVPNFTFENGYMVLGFTTSDVKRALGRLSREDDPADDIRTNSEFAPLLAQLPKDGVSSVSFTDWKASFESAYSIVASLSMLIPMDPSIPFEPELLPEQSTLTQHLSGGLTWSHEDANGFRSTSVGPFGPETIAILAGAVGVGVGVAASTGMIDDMPIRIR